MITNFYCFKVDEKKSEKSPDYRLSAKIGDEFVEIGAGWIKQGEHTKHISFKLSDPYKERSGFAIKEIPGDIVPEEIADTPTEEKTIEYPDKDMTPDF